MKQAELNKKALEKPPPHNVEAEHAVLGAILLDNHALYRVQDIMSGADFYRPGHQKIFEAMCALADRGEVIDLLLLNAELERLRQSDETGGPAYLAALVDCVPSAANVEHHARLVHSKALSRQVLYASWNLISRLYDDAEDVPTLVSEAKAIMDAAHREIGIQDAQAFWVTGKNGLARDIDIDRLLSFLENKGFYMLDIYETSMFVNVVAENVCAETRWKKGVCTSVKRFLKKYCRKEIGRQDVWKVCASSGKLFGNQTLTGLDALDKAFCADSPSAVYLYFQNGALKITATQVEFLKYEQMPGLVWQENMSPHEYHGEYVGGTLLERLKTDLRKARKDKDGLRLKVLQVLIGEIETAKFRQKEPLTEDAERDLVDMVRAWNEEATVACRTRPHNLANLSAEKSILAGYAGQTPQMSVYEQFIEYVAKDQIEFEVTDDATKKPTPRHIDVDNRTAYHFALAHLAIQHNHQANARAIVLADSNPTAASNGRRGKKIILEAFKYLRGKKVVVKVDGKKFNHKERFMLQRVKPNTKVVIIDDVDTDFDFKGLYSAITDGLTVEAKGAGFAEFAFDFEQNPKIAITTNHPCYGEDLSSVDRAILLPVSDYFRKQGKTPYQVFGHTLFNDWDPQEWDRFYDFFVRIIQQYLHWQNKNPSIVPIVDLTIFNAYKLLLSVPEAIITALDNLKPDVEYKYDAVMQAIEDAGFKFRSKQEFTAYLHKYCQLKSFRMGKNTKDGRLMRNNVQYLRLEPVTPPMPGMNFEKTETK